MGILWGLWVGLPESVHSSAALKDGAVVQRSAVQRGLALAPSPGDQRSVASAPLAPAPIPLAERTQGLVESAPLGQPIGLEVESEPSGTLFIDGKMLGLSPYHGTVSADGREHALLVTASGHLPQERAVSFRSPLFVKLTLPPRRKR
jgi:hypothetical protein